MLPNPKNIQGWPCWLAIALFVLLDWISKTFVRTHLTPGSSVSIFGNILKITYVQNHRGVSWFVPDVPSWSKYFLSGLFLVVIIAAYPVYLFYVNQRRQTLWVDIAFVGIMASCTGHLLNDLFLPYTTDFIQVYSSPSANFADIYSYIGIIALIVEAILIHRNQKNVWKGLRAWVEERKVLRNEILEYFRRKR